MKVPNFKQTTEVFKKYMLKTFDFDVSKADLKLEETLFHTMKQIKSSGKYTSLTVIDLNNLALNNLRDVYVDKFKLVQRKKPNVKSLERETSLFGDREVTSMQLLPMNTNNSKESVVGDFDRILKVRNEAGTIKTSKDEIIGQLESAIDMDEFQTKLSSLEETRKNVVVTPPPNGTVPTFDMSKREDDYLISSIQTQRPKVSIDPKTLYQDISKTTNYKEGEKLVQVTPDFVNHAQFDIIPQASKRMLSNKYLIINGFDRDWTMHFQRFRFAIDMANLSKPYRNIESIKFTSLILPMEIEEEKSIINSQPKSYYFHENKLAFPYVMLQIDEMSDMYDGFNQAAQKCHTQFGYDRAYKAPNGRGYIVMKPLQDEIKQYPNLLGVLPKLTMSVVRPNGTLFNNSMDNYSVIKIDYTVYNDKYIQIVFDKYFDKNEFYIGDNIMIKGFVIKQPVPPDPCLSPSHYQRMTDWVNRSEGHEIHQLGEANEHGFTNNVFVSAPSTFDQSAGKLTVDKQLVDTLRFYYQAYPVILPNPKVNGRAINTSLQVVMSMTMTLDSGDLRILGSGPP